MKILYVLLFTPILLWSQFGNPNEKPILWSSTDIVDIPSKYLAADKDKIQELSQEPSNLYIVATGIPTDIFFSDFKLVKVLPSGDKVYQYQITSENALGLRIQFQNLQLDPQARIWLYNQDKTDVVGSYSRRDVLSDGSLLTSYIHSNTGIIEILEPRNSHISNFHITTVHHFFRGLKSTQGFGSSQSCMLNVACSEGDNYSVEQLATCKIVITGIKDGSAFTGFCSGTLLNNTRLDGSPIVLTANHCSEFSSLADLQNWQYQFYYQSTTCSAPLLEPSKLTMLGSTALAYSGTDNGQSSSDFLLVLLNQRFSQPYDVTFLGWDRSTGVPSSGVCIHHPDGDIKKISTYSTPATIASYSTNFPLANNHLRVRWAATANGHSVTQGGSSGSGLLNQNKLLVGTLTGGASDCSAQNEPDYYGRFAMHWSSFGSNSDQRVDVHLDPIGTGATSLGSIKLSQASLQDLSTKKELSISLDDNYLHTQWNHRNYELAIYNLLGEKIYATTADGYSSAISISHLPRGIYLVEATNGVDKEVKKFSF